MAGEGSGPVGTSNMPIPRSEGGLRVPLAKLGSTRFDLAEALFRHFTLESRALQRLVADFLYRFFQSLFQGDFFTPVVHARKCNILFCKTQDAHPEQD
jgi:hypothetical protein